AVPDGAPDSCRRHYWSTGGSESLRDRTRQTRNGIEPFGSYTGFQLARHYPRANTRWVAHLERGAISHRTAAATLATSLARVSCTTGRLGQAAVHRNQPCAAVARSGDCEI